MELMNKKSSCVAVYSSAQEDFRFLLFSRLVPDRYIGTMVKPHWYVIYDASSVMLPFEGPIWKSVNCVLKNRCCCTECFVFKYIFTTFNAWNARRAFHRHIGKCFSNSDLTESPLQFNAVRISEKRSPLGRISVYQIYALGKLRIRMSLLQGLWWTR